MNKIFFTFCIALSFVLQTVCYAETDYDLDEYLSDIRSVRNPFTPQLPKVERKKAVKKTKKSQEEKERSRQRAQAIPVEEPPEEPPEPVLPNLMVSGLVWNSDRPQAIINGEVVSVGESILNLKVIAIRKEGIDINFNGNILTIKTQKEQ